MTNKELQTGNNQSSIKKTGLKGGDITELPLSR